jgi:hypothetical protein
MMRMKTTSQMLWIAARYGQVVVVTRDGVKMIGLRDDTSRLLPLLLWALGYLEYAGYFNGPILRITNKGRRAAVAATLRPVAS